ncbi:MAG: L,D-transpeptidase [Saprospiraceae bacterium]|nr:L,D-transpeptidase [Saprospiraceae bacterium]
MKRIDLLLFVVVAALLTACRNDSPKPNEKVSSISREVPKVAGEQPVARIPVTEDVRIASYFTFIDALVAKYDTLAPYKLTEHLLVRANPWLIDSLAATDYYLQMAKGNYVHEQRQTIVLHAGDTLQVPGPLQAARILEAMNNTLIDVNIPAFRLRVLQSDSVLFEVPVRVGKNKTEYLEMAGREVDLRTRTGEGTVIRINNDPTVYNPVTGEKYDSTKRDDKRYTTMPRIPWLETITNGIRTGQMIHPTSNPKSLGKPASNGCIGMGEADAWRVYYHAPLGTRVRIRYNLTEITPGGDTLEYKDIYEYRRKTAKAQILPFGSSKPLENLCACDTLK